MKNYKRNKWPNLIKKFCNCLICRKPRREYVDVIKSFNFDSSPEPNDIMWENLYYKFTIPNLIGTSFASCCIILLSFGIIYFLKKLDKNSSLPLEAVYRKIVSFAIAIFIMIVNISLREFIKLLTKCEHHWTHTAFNLSVGVKLTLARFVNSAIVPVIINIKFERWFVDGGLVFDIFTVMIMIAIVDPIS